MWKFKNQGNSHKVYDKYPNILRIPIAQNENQEYVRDYHEHVTTRLLGGKYYSKLEITALDHIQIDGGQITGYGLRQTDYTTSLTSTKVLTVEIKPKYASRNDSTCDFCKHSYLKHSKGGKEFMSEFCPFDLFSLDAARMVKSLHALDKYSRLKIFYNGSLKGSDGILNMYSSAQEYFEDIVRILLKEPILVRLNESHMHARNISLEDLSQTEITKQKTHHGDVDQLLKILESFHVKCKSDVNKFLISKSLMDVSIMIKIEDNYSHGSEKIGKYYYTIGVIDVQPKDINKLGVYSQTQKEISIIKGVRDCPLV